MRKSIITLFLNCSLLIVISAFSSPHSNVTSEAIQWTKNEIVLNFPESATFRAAFTSDADITSIVLEYGNEQQTCGEVIAKAFPQFTPGKTVEAEWTWEMRQSGSLPPGAQLWWRWRVTDANGEETVTETKTATWLDDVHNWQTMNQGESESVHLHWYEGSQAFAADLANAAEEGLLFNETQSGLKAEAPIDIYIFADTDDLKDAILYEPSWTGGQAFPDQNIVILGISQSDLDWGRDAIVHELTHVLVGHLTFSCLGDVPTWLNEGLAVYSEGELDPASERQLEDAIRDNTLLTVRSLSSGFSEVADKAYLSYSQSYSITKFLVETHGQEKMTSLLLSLRDGLTIDEALMQTYGFNVEGLEAAWRVAIGAQPLSNSTQLTSQPTPTFVPTIVPVGGQVSSALQVTSTPVPTSSFGGEPTQTQTSVRTGPPLALTMILLGMCCAFLILIGVVVLGFVVRRQNRQGGNNE
ncbi:MAG TPA: peptidase MA family metallohydrolase [Anaerolineales bacterium]|nr:peptidase MA family metallohydrolase [Anaerolineales bacterium]